ncbi:MAG TPA: hypothetical protein H9903_01195 [Candidatus Aquabacterium excrementipullorum]|nr:hypothetical protein [Candidatus Aquabacterium excrementipullorum]
MSTVLTTPAPTYAPPVAPATSAVSWGAIFAGAAAAAALSLILLILGAGLGLSSFSPWTGVGVSATTFGVSAILWITLTQLAASGLGGYLAGRLRTRWTDLQTDEVYFRDTAHGLLAWAVASLVTAAALTTTIGAVLGQGPRAGGPVGEPSATVQGRAVDAYYIDTLFRPDPAHPLAVALPPPNAEVARVVAKGLREGALLDEDVRYLGQLVAQRTGLSQPAAEKRVTDTFQRAKDAAAKAAKAAGHASLWMFISLLAGAFVASWLATYGGRRRDL